MRPSLRRLIPICVSIVLLAFVSACDQPISQGPPTPPAFDGLPLMTVGEVLQGREDGELQGARVALMGFWSDASIGHGCAPPREPTGDLEIYCHDGEWGITELAEPIMTIAASGEVTEPRGPHLTPFIPQGLDRAEELFHLNVRAPNFVPTPIVVIGHFDDPLAARCRPQARQLCLDRLVLERIAQLGDHELQ
jgi:hypothetical protein